MYGNHRASELLDTVTNTGQEIIGSVYTQTEFKQNRDRDRHAFNTG